MALADPQSIKISGETTSLPRTSTGMHESEYESADGLIKLRLSTAASNKGRKRQTVRVDVSKITEDPFVPTQNTEVSMSCYVVFDRPPVGYSNTEAKAVYDGFIESLQASSSKVVTQLLGGES